MSTSKVENGNSLNNFCQMASRKIAWFCTTHKTIKHGLHFNKLQFGNGELHGCCRAVEAIYPGFALLLYDVLKNFIIF